MVTPFKKSTFRFINRFEVKRCFSSFPINRNYGISDNKLKYAVTENIYKKNAKRRTSYISRRINERKIKIFTSQKDKEESNFLRQLSSCLQTFTSSKRIRMNNYKFMERARIRNVLFFYFEFIICLCRFNVNLTMPRKQNRFKRNICFWRKF